LREIAETPEDNTVVAGLFALILNYDHWGYTRHSVQDESFTFGKVLHLLGFHCPELLNSLVILQGITSHWVKVRFLLISFKGAN